MCPYTPTEAKASYVLWERGLQPKGPGDAPSISPLSLVINAWSQTNLHFRLFLARVLGPQQGNFV